jgi:hypothetical protein
MKMVKIEILIQQKNIIEITCYFFHTSLIPVRLLKTPMLKTLRAKISKTGVGKRWIIRNTITKFKKFYFYKSQIEMIFHNLH